jgi:hypothetical protein
MKTQFKVGRRFRVLLPLIMTAVQLGLLAASLIVPRQPWVVPYPPESHQSQSQCSGVNCASFSPGSSDRGNGRLVYAAMLLNLPALILAAFLDIGLERLHVHTNESSILAFTAVFVPLIWYRVGKWIDDQSMFQNQNQSTHLRMKSAWKIVVRVVVWCLLGFSLISSMGGNRDYITAALILWTGAYLAGGLVVDWRTRSNWLPKLFFWSVVVCLICFAYSLLLFAHEFIVRSEYFLHSESSAMPFRIFALLIVLTIPFSLIVSFGMANFCASADRSSARVKVLWFLLFFGTWPIGSIVYFFTVYRGSIKSARAEQLSLRES